MAFFFNFSVHVAISTWLHQKIGSTQLSPGQTLIHVAEAFAPIMMMMVVVTGDNKPKVNVTILLTRHSKAIVTRSERLM